MAWANTPSAPVLTDPTLKKKYSYKMIFSKESLLKTQASYITQMADTQAFLKVIKKMYSSGHKKI